MENNLNISAISIDLGAKYTGLVTFNKKDSDCFKTNGYLLKISNNLVLTMKNRRARRHQRRGIKRRKLAKRLFWEIFNDYFKDFQIDNNDKIFINGLFNRRGYTFITQEINEEDKNFLEEIEETKKDLLFKKLNNILKDKDKSILGQLLEIKYLEKVNEMLDEINKFSQEKNLDKEIKKAISIIKNYLESLKKENLGSKKRETYLNDIKEDFSTFFKNKKIEIEEDKINKITNLIGNISNLQLRVLRKYFNGKKDNKFCEEKFKKKMVNWIKTFHFIKKEEIYKKNYFKEFLDHINKNGILDALINFDPQKTIPPYEDQNNRNIDKCSSLYISKEKISKLFPNWEEIVDNIIKKLKLDDYKDITNGLDCKKDKNKILQRLFDWNKKNDIFEFRKIVNLKKENLTLNSNFLDEENCKKLYDIASIYYEEVEKAKKGLWDNTTSLILEKCNKNPCQKKNLRHLLVGQILFTNLDKNLNDFITNLWNSKIENGINKTLKSWCLEAEKIRKKYGNSFKYIYEKIKYKQDKDLTVEEKNIKKIFEEAKIVAKRIGEYFKQQKLIYQKYSNPFSLSQLANILETDIQGFSRECQHCLIEDNFRMSNAIKEGEGYMAKAQRLVHDSVRPIDGVLRRSIDIHSKKIAEIKCKEIEEFFKDKNEEIYIPIIIEQNDFAFTESINILKKKKNKILSSLTNNEKVTNEEFQQKFKRIKVNTYCPYTGKIIGEQGEIDHIIPRSFSLKEYGTIFNHECNLIWTSKDGNQQKKDQYYHLSNLSKEYLKEIFKTDDTTKIEEEIKFFFDNFKNEDIYSLDDDQKKYIRHSLFSSNNEIRKKGIDIIKSQYLASRVNGVQMFLVKLIVKNIRKYFNQNIKLKFDVIRVKSDLISEARKRVGEKLDFIKKSKENQSAYSHIIDAYFALIVKNRDIEYKIFEIIENDIKKSDVYEIIKDSLPNNLKIINIERKPDIRREKIKCFSKIKIFDDSIFSENFLSLIVQKGRIKIGFTPNNSIDITDSINIENFYKLIQNFLVIKSETLKNNQSQIFKFNKVIVQNFLHETFRQKVKGENLNEKDIFLENFFNSIAYYTIRKDINLILDKKNKLSSFSKIEKNLKLKFEIKKDKTIFLNDVNGELILPSKNEWKKIYNNIKQKGYKIGDKVDNLEKIYNEQFVKIKPNRKHFQWTRKISLPIISSPSGGFRIKKKDNNGNVFYQIKQIKSSYYQGFDKNLKKKFIHNFYEQSKNISMTKTIKYTPIKDKEKIFMDEWRKVEIPDKYKQFINNLIVSPGTSERAYVIVEMNKDQFKKLLNDNLIDKLSDNLLNLKSSINKKDLNNSFFEKELKDLLQKPQEKEITILFIESNKVIFKYTLEKNFPQLLKNLYLKGKKIDYIY